MTSKQHLPPEAFIDMIEGSPVDACWRQHVDACAECRTEIAMLRSTVDELRRDVEPVLDRAEDSVAPAPRPAVRSYRLLLPVAAALLIALVSWMLHDRLPSLPTNALDQQDRDSLLPPADQDGEYQVLLAVSGSSEPGVEDSEELDWIDADDDYELFGVPSLDPDELTPEEQDELIRQLTIDMTQEVS